MQQQQHRACMRMGLECTEYSASLNLPPAEPRREQHVLVTAAAGHVLVTAAAGAMARPTPSCAACATHERCSGAFTAALRLAWNRALCAVLTVLQHILPLVHVALLGLAAAGQAGETVSLEWFYLSAEPFM